VAMLEIVAPQVPAPCKVSQPVSQSSVIWQCHAQFGTTGQHTKTPNTPMARWGMCQVIRHPQS
jgi:hypothetical protein